MEFNINTCKGCVKLSVLMLASFSRQKHVYFIEILEQIYVYRPVIVRYLPLLIICTIFSFFLTVSFLSVFSLFFPVYCLRVLTLVSKFSFLSRSNNLFVFLFDVFTPYFYSLTSVFLSN